MSHTIKYSDCVRAGALALCLCFTTSAMAHDRGAVLGNATRFPDVHGQFTTFSAGGAINTSNAFFQSLGTNGRACVTCHQPRDAWSLTPAHIQQTFFLTAGRDPLFRPVDGANCPDADVSSFAKRWRAYSLLLRRGLIRVEMEVPPNAEFSVLAVDNPYGCDNAGKLSVYRRPLPATNVAFLSTVMWDGRETFPGKNIIEDLEHQAVSATLGHAQADQAPTPEQVQEIVDFETQIFTAQVRDWGAGELDSKETFGGPLHLAQTDFFLGINDPLGLNPSGKPFSSEVFQLYGAWRKADLSYNSSHARARRAVARGEELFNTLRVPIKGVAGLNDVPLQDGAIHPMIDGFCGTCHDTPNIGHHSVPAPLNIGIADAARRLPDMPLITLLNTTTGDTVQTIDPGRAMVTGKWSDIGKFKGPILRALAARAPYFHDGSATTLLDVVSFYDTRFELHLTAQQKSDLVAFLATL